jgi:hypothetical protein
MNQEYLKITSSLFILSFIFFIFYSKKNINEILLAFALIIIFLTSQLFWNNPIEGSIVHKIDGYAAKIIIIYFLIYTLFFKQLQKYILYSYIFFILFAFMFFYKSDNCSKIKWCSEDHLYNHCISHIFCFIASLYAFL